MTPRSLTPLLLALVSPVGCQCADRDLVELSSDASSGSPDKSSSDSRGTSDDSSGDPFDVSRWIGRYHYETVFLPFGERGDPHGSYSLANFEILPNSRATLFYQECWYDEPIVITYTWTPVTEEWIELHPGPGEESLRYMGAEDLETLRVRLIEPCRELRFEVDGREDGWSPFHPGASCWVDKCTTPGIIQVDYCEGEEPEDPCP
ncbi:hypothetical protein [Paraliomyxa miuraensis]|uniref:hypothetical protein n=1 Tax=Paraliomyxa miuraensis TaxID=376150 RepID=UPI0022528B98|nr:hypothetical protein [Paraliomyxa miuraensis]MCX4239977.1 hypothetical protein [Paraliomyxa miuraensis]